MDAIIPQFFFSLSAGGFGGFLIGYATKKVVKIVAIVLGLYLLSLIYLMQIKVIEIDFENLFLQINSIFNQTIEFFSNIIPFLTITGSFACGFIIGIIKG